MENTKPKRKDLLATFDDYKAKHPECLLNDIVEVCKLADAEQDAKGQASFKAEKTPEELLSIKRGKMIIAKEKAQAELNKPKGDILPKTYSEIAFADSMGTESAIFALGHNFYITGKKHVSSFGFQSPAAPSITFSKAQILKNGADYLIRASNFAFSEYQEMALRLIEQHLNSQRD